MENIPIKQGFKFRCTEPVITNRGVLFCKDSEFIVNSVYKKEVTINTDLDAWLSGVRVSDTELQYMSDISFDEILKDKYDKLNAKYKMCIMIDFISVVNSENIKMDFSLQTIDEIINVYDLDSTKDVKFEGTIFEFKKHFDCTEVLRNDKIERLLK